MKKLKVFLKWFSLILVVLTITIFAFGYWFVGLIPPLPNQDDLMNIQASSLPYLADDKVPSKGKILAVVTSCDVMGNSKKSTGYELTELSRAYYVFQANGYEVDIASPKGGNPPVLIDDEDMGEYDYAFLNDSIAQQKVSNSIPMGSVDKEAYEAIYFVGGKGAMFDFPQNPHIQTIVKDYYYSDKVIGAVCHGPAALVNVTLDDGTSLLANKRVSSFTNREELFLIPDAEEIFPFLLEDKLVEKGAQFNEGIMYLKNVTADQNIVTGQNPWSTWEIAETMIKSLGHTPKPRLITPDENAVVVLGIYETRGMDEAKSEIDKIYNVRSEPFNRTLLALHGVVSAMQFDIVKAVNLVRLMSYAKNVAEG